MQRLFQNLFHLHAAYSKILPHADDVTSISKCFFIQIVQEVIQLPLFSFVLSYVTPLSAKYKKAYLCGNLKSFMIEHKKILMKINDKKLLLLIDLRNIKMH